MMRREIVERYQKDSTFKRAVDFIESLIGNDGDLTSLDIRDAAYLARLKFEEKNVQPILYLDRKSEFPMVSEIHEKMNLTLSKK